ncbi:hypothetical protein E3P91_04554, partial [Wallemia ichthyophaga]
MTIFYNQPSDLNELSRINEFNFPIEFFLKDNAPVKHNATPSTSKARLDLIQHDNSYEARVDLAGYKKEQLEISIHDHKISVKASKPAEEESKKSDEQRYLISEINSAPSISRTWRLPEHITEDNIHAAYDNGLLTLRYSRHAPESE